MSAQRVVVGVDGSAPSFVALDAAAIESQRRTADLEVVYCVADLDEGGPILRAAASRVAKRHPGLTVNTTAVVGDPADVLVERGRDAVLTVVGSRGIGGFAGLMVPSVSHRVAARSDVPLLVVKGTDARHTSRRIRREGVLLALENDDDADAALFAFEEAELRHAQVDVPHVWTYRQALLETLDPHPTVPAQERIPHRTAAAAALPGEFVTPSRLAYPRREFGTRPVRSTPCRDLIAATADAELVVIAAHRRRNRPRIQLEPLTRALLHHAQCPVAIVPAPEG